MDDVANRRTRGIATTIEGYFAAAWFGWAQTDPPSWLVAPLIVGSVLGFGLAVVGVLITIRARGQHSPLRDPALRRPYLIIVGVEFAALGVGAGLFSTVGLSRWICVLVCAGVGVHFLPLSRVLPGLLLVPAGVLITAVALAAVGLTSNVSPCTITAAAGVCLLVAAVLTITRTAGAEPDRQGF